MPAFWQVTASSPRDVCMPAFSEVCASEYHLILHLFAKYHVVVLTAAAVFDS